jgi:hypothetical protein
MKGGAVIVHKARLPIACGGRGGREHPPLTHIQSNACRFLFLLFSYLRFAEAASFDKKELCRSDTVDVAASSYALLKTDVFNKSKVLTIVHSNGIVFIHSKKVLVEVSNNKHYVCGSDIYLIFSFSKQHIFQK